MASGHEPPLYTLVMNKVIVASAIMAIDRVHKRFVFYHKAGGTGLSLATELE